MFDKLKEFGRFLKSLPGIYRHGSVYSGDPHRPFNTFPDFALWIHKDNDNPKATFPFVGKMGGWLMMCCSEGEYFLPDDGMGGAVVKFDRALL